MFSQKVITDWLSWCWPALLNHLWQATLFAAIALIVVSLLMKRGSARGRYLILLLAAIKFAVPSALFVLLSNRVGVDFSSLFAPSAQPSTSLQSISPLLSPVAVPTTIPSHAEPIFLSPSGGMAAQALVPHDYTTLYYALTAVWLAGCLLLLVRWWKRRQQLSLALMAGERSRSGREWQALSEVLSWLRISRRVELLISPKVTEPGVWGILRPVVVLPQGISDQLSDRELEAVMLHEMIHVLRWDNLVSNLQMVLCCCFWFHPLVWLIDKHLLAEREQACDERVINLGGASDIYASSITKIYRFCLGWKVSGLSSIGGSNLRRRIERIAAGDVSARIPLMHKALVASLCAGMVFISIVVGARNTDRALAQAKMPDKNVPSRRPAAIASNAISANLRELATVNATTETAGIETTVRLAGPHAQVLVSSTDNVAPLSPPPMQIVASQPPPPPQPPQLAAPTAHHVDLRKYVGRYAVDPAVMENFIFDVSLEGDELWLKPSYSPKQRLIALSSVEFVDSTSDDINITFNWDETGNVRSLTFRGWGQDMKVMKLALPQPSVDGNTTFRLGGYPNARIVAVAGTFNNWNQSQFLFAKVDGEWICKINLPPGKYEYKFIVDGNWLVDPRNPKTERDDRGFENSVLIAE